MRQEKASSFMIKSYPSWDPRDLLVTLFGIALAWAHWPDPAAATTSAAVLGHRRAAAVEAASRVVSPAR